MSLGKCILSPRLLTQTKALRNNPLVSEHVGIVLRANPKIVSVLKGTDMGAQMPRCS